MRLEALAPFSIRHHEQVQTFMAGQQFQLPDAQAGWLLQRASQKVRRVPDDAVSCWVRLATLTDGMYKDDPRFPAVMQALDECDGAFAAGDHATFKAAEARVERAMSNRWDMAAPCEFRRRQPGPSGSGGIPLV